MNSLLPTKKCLNTMPLNNLTITSNSGLLGRQASSLSREVFAKLQINEKTSQIMLNQI